MPLRAFRPFAALLLATSAWADDEKVPVQFINSDVRDALAFYEKLTGLRIVYSNQLTGNLFLFVNDPVPREKAVELIEMGLFANGYPIVQIKPDVVRIFAIGEMPASVGLPVITKVEDLPKGERVITFPFRLKKRDPRELAQMLSLQIPPAPSGISRFVADPASKTVLLTGPTSTVRNAIKLLEAWEQPPAK